MVEVSELKKMYDEWLSSETTECERPLSNSKETLDTKDLKVNVSSLIFISRADPFRSCELDHMRQRNTIT